MTTFEKGPKKFGTEEMVDNRITLHPKCPRCGASPEVLVSEMYLEVGNPLLSIYSYCCNNCGLQSPWAVDHLSAYFAMADKKQNEDAEEDSE